MARWRGVCVWSGGGGLGVTIRPSGSLLVRTSTHRVRRNITSFLISMLREGGLRGFGRMTFAVAFEPNFQ